jgi:hypothetical protein
MSQNLDLKAIEHKAFRSIHQDGLQDMYIGLILIACYFLLNIPDHEDLPLSNAVPAIVMLVTAFVVYQVGKKYITAPRMGQVKFGPERQKRKLTLARIMGIFVLITLGLVLFSLYVWRTGGTALGHSESTNSGLERILVSTIAALIAGTSTIVIAYYKEFLRGYYIGLVMGAAFFLALWLDAPVFIAVAAVLVFLPGLVLFIKFLREHPLPATEASHGES